MASGYFAAIRGAAMRLATRIRNSARAALLQGIQFARPAGKHGAVTRLPQILVAPGNLIGRCGVNLPRGRGGPETRDAGLQWQEDLDVLLVRSELGGSGTRVSAVTNRRVEAGQLELRREDLRQNVAVTARTSNRDLGSAIRDIRAKLDKEMPDRRGFTLEYGGLYQQQQESFKNLVMVTTAAVLLVFLVLLVEFRSLLAPLAIVWGRSCHSSASGWPCGSLARR
jgi:hypothetical protein